MSKRDIILSIDTAMSGCAAAVLVRMGGDLPERSAAAQEATARGQAARLIPMVEEVMQEAGIGFQDLTAIATTIGPGAFTGLRLGMSAARSFSLALEVPLHGITTLEILARQYLSNNPGNKSNIHVLVETKRQDFYVQSFDKKGKALSEPCSAVFDNVMDIITGSGSLSEASVIGDALDRFTGILKESDRNLPQHIRLVEGYLTPDPLEMAKACAEGGLRPDPHPVYLRGADVSFPAKTPRKLQESDYSGWKNDIGQGTG